MNLDLNPGSLWKIKTTSTKSNVESFKIPSIISLEENEIYYGIYLNTFVGSQHYHKFLINKKTYWIIDKELICKL